MATRTVIWALQDEARPDQAPVGLSREIQRLPGVVDVSIQPVAGTVELVYDDARTDLDRVRRLLADHGYPTGSLSQRDQEAA